MIRRLAAMTLLALAPFAATAQEPVANNTVFGDWVVNCQALTTERTICRLVQSLTRTEDGSLVARFAALAQNNGNVLLLAQVPIGSYLATQPAVRAKEPTDAPSLPLVWQQCGGQICEAARSVTPEELETYTATGGFLFGYKPTREGEAVIVPVNLGDGFTEGMAAIRNAGGN